jgi:hypothetical protein
VLTGMRAIGMRSLDHESIVVRVVSTANCAR